MFVFPFPFPEGKWSFTQHKQGSNPWHGAGTRAPNKIIQDTERSTNQLFPPRASQACSHTSNIYLILQGLDQICIWFSCALPAYTTQKLCLDHIRPRMFVLWLQTNAYVLTQHWKHCAVLLLLRVSKAFSSECCVKVGMAGYVTPHAGFHKGSSPPGAPQDWDTCLKGWFTFPGVSALITCQILKRVQLVILLPSSSSRYKKPSVISSPVRSLSSQGPGPWVHCQSWCWETAGQM